MCTHNIGLYEHMTKIIFQLSSNVIKYAVPTTLLQLYVESFKRTVKTQKNCEKRRLESYLCDYLLCQMSSVMRKPDFCICEKQRHRAVDQRLCFRYTYSTIPLLLKSEISSL